MVNINRDRKTVFDEAARFLEAYYSEDFGPAYEVGAFMYAYEVAANDPLPRLLADGFEGVMRRPAAHTYMNGGLDAGYFNAMGIPAVMFGPGDMAMAHTAHDLVGIEHCADAASVYASTMLADRGTAVSRLCQNRDLSEIREAVRVTRPGSPAAS